MINKQKNSPSLQQINVSVCRWIAQNRISTLMCAFLYFLNVSYQNLCTTNIWRNLVTDVKTQLGIAHVNVTVTTQIKVLLFYCCWGRRQHRLISLCALRFVRIIQVQVYYRAVHYTNTLTPNVFPTLCIAPYTYVCDLEMHSLQL